MRKAIETLFAALICACVWGAASAQQSKKIEVNFRETELKNGLRVITVEDHSAPVIALTVTYNVGSRDERKGRTGFAHLFEHMMFQGSENVGKGEHFYRVFNNGGEMNGATNEDRTTYFEMLPSNQLDLLLFLEADRMRSLEITQENLDNQRNTVQEERRLRVDNRPYGKSDEVMQELLYDNFAYKHTTIGSMEDLNAATVDDVKAFFKIYYAPNNAVLTLVGDFSTGAALARIRKYFEDIPRQPAPPAVDMTEPEQKSERRVTVEDALARLPRVEIAFKAVPGETKDFYALWLLSRALQGGQSSRLYQKLVRDREVLVGVGGTITSKRGAGALYFSATLKAGQKVADVEAAIYEEIERIKKDSISEPELEKGKEIQRRLFIAAKSNSLATAVTLGMYAVDFGDPHLINTRFSRFAAVTTEDVRRVANKYLVQSNRTVVVTTPKPKKADVSAKQ